MTFKIPPTLTEEMTVEYKAYFDALDIAGQQKVSVVDLPILMRRCGLMPTNAEIEDLVKIVDKDNKAMAEGLDFGQFCQIVTMKLGEIYTPEQILESFRILDLEGNGALSYDDLHAALCTSGEVLTDEELAAMVRVSPKDKKGNVLYEQFITKMSSDRYR